MSLSSSISDMNTGLDSFSSSLKTSWKGRAGEHLGSLVDSKIKPVIQKLEEKSSKLEQAAGIAAEIDQHIKLKNDYIAARNSCNTETEEGKSRMGYYSSMIAQEEAKIEQLKSQIKGLLG